MPPSRRKRLRRKATRLSNMDGTGVLSGFLVLGLFLIMLVLGGLLVQVIAWEQQLRGNRERLIHQMRDSAGRLRQVRRQLQAMGHGVPGLELSPGNRRKLGLLRLVLRTLARRKP